MDNLRKQADMSNDTCPVDGCTKALNRGGYCYGHYMKNWRYGTPTPQHPDRRVDLTGQRFGALVALRRDGRAWVCQCDCGAETIALVGDLNRGNAISCGDRRIHYRRDDAGYYAAHSRVKRDRGPIKSHRCVDCGGPAAQWSYDHTDPDELLAYGLSANALAYSLDPMHYSPRCVSCHKRFDLDKINATHQAA